MEAHHTNVFFKDSKIEKFKKLIFGCESNQLKSRNRKIKHVCVKFERILKEKVKGGMIIMSWINQYIFIIFLFFYFFFIFVESLI